MVIRNLAGECAQEYAKRQVKNLSFISDIEISCQRKKNKREILFPK